MKACWYARWIPMAQAPRNIKRSDHRLMASAFRLNHRSRNSPTSFTGPLAIDYAGPIRGDTP